jgi:pyruvate kinase
LGEENLILIPENVVDVLEKGHLILVDDGLCQFEVDKKADGVIQAKAFDSFTVKHRKTMSIPGVVTDMPVLIENDFVQLDGIQNDEVDYVALSFVRNRKDVETLRAELEKRDLSAGIVSKIENQSALDNLDEIIDASDALMIARGDLGVEVPFEELIYWQKMMIHKCRAACIPVITATHMLETMIKNPLPTRAEISDVANAVYDKTDAVMLSGETTIGKFPVRVVNTQARIVHFNEKNVDVDLTDYLQEVHNTNVVDAAIYLLAHELEDIDAVICLTETGKTAAQISRSRPKLPIHVLTGTEKVYNQLALNFGVIPHLLEWDACKIMNAQEIMQKLGKVDWLKSGQRVLVVFGEGCQWKEPDQINTMSIITV